VSNSSSFVKNPLICFLCCPRNPQNLSQSFNLKGVKTSVSFAKKMTERDVLTKDLAGASRALSDSWTGVPQVPTREHYMQWTFRKHDLKLTSVDRCSSVNCTNEFLIGAVRRTITVHAWYAVQLSRVESWTCVWEPKFTKIRHSDSSVCKIWSCKHSYPGTQH